MIDWIWMPLVWVISLASLGYAGWLAYEVLRGKPGTPKMHEVAAAIQEGAHAFVKRQYVTIAIISLLVAAGIWALYHFMGKGDEAWRTVIAFLFGALSSSIAGIVGMLVSVRANLRTAIAAQRNLNAAMQAALRGGAVSAITIVSMSLLGIAVLYKWLGATTPEAQIPFLLVGYGFGASFVALFAQLGGGIYTKAADVGADLVGKVEAGIPEDDPRNPAVVADLVGDNVGDCAGRGADLFESTAAENIGAMILGVALYPVFGMGGILFPLVVRAFGLIASIVGLQFVKVKENGSVMGALNKGYFITAVLSAIGFYIAVHFLLGGSAWFFWAGVVGIVTSVLIVLITMYYTEGTYAPVKRIAKASVTGHATNIIEGFATALECTAAPVLVLSAALLISYKFGLNSGFDHGGLYGTALATMGMLATAAYVLAMDNFGPITDNAGGIATMGGAPAIVRKRTDKLDAAGNTTKALTKGYAIGSAALAAFLLFSAYLDEVQHAVTAVSGEAAGLAARVIDFARVDVFVGGLLGSMLVFLFAALAIKAVSTSACAIIDEVRRQFRTMPGIMKGTQKPDYARCVDICAKAALKHMVLPGLLVLVFTVLVGVMLRAQATAGFLMSATISGILLALVLNTGGGAWDNAKKHIEDGHHGGKGSDAHKAAVTGDTIGDPFKDTAGPSLHVLIKLLGTITLVLAPLFI